MTTVQQRIAAFPAAIAVDLRQLETCQSDFGVVLPGVPGYIPLYADIRDLEVLDQIVCVEYDTRKPTPAERDAALAGSVFGWHVKAADPAEYAKEGADA